MHARRIAEGKRRQEAAAAEAEFRARERYAAAQVGCWAKGGRERVIQ